MIRQGGLCRNCTASKCVDVATEIEPIEIECPICYGLDDNCKECKNGFIKIDGCPNEYCREMIEATEVIDYFHDGQSPVVGGTLDQSAQFLEAARRLKTEDANAKAELNVAN